ncbi:hypothetical protein [Roseinatronobacter alkalisoli]|uniref:Alpha/beta hydrolase n=1 Tax=Roseinatronobacter alkalisoli TaxID=3028235 RepID=A0ABT5TE90_9RHOB|nr:hypothetical protein [Roseinatronobacter sp. HJB301]MDD7972497.1 hypothetical protein [Roseinatronobacter sp. HJB301]
MLKLVLVAFAIYALVIGLLAIFQTSLIFPRALVGPAPSLPGQTERLTLRSADGDELHGVRIPGRRNDTALLLGFGGNAWNAESLALFLHQHAPDHPVATFHFRGYSPSTGTPSAQALRGDAVLIHDVLSDGAPGTIAVGFSVGAGAAAYLGAVRELKGVLLVTPFDSLHNVARGSMPWVPVRWLLRHDMNPLSDLRDRQIPVAILTATGDEVIPPARSEALIAGLMASDSARLHVARIPAGHNDIYSHPEFNAALRAALAHIAR